MRGLDVFKLSPKKNCKECGSPTCMAFCMKVAQGAADLDSCPYFSAEAKAMLAEQSQPLMRTVSLTGGLRLGGETVLFRHEKTFVSKNLYAIRIGTEQTGAEIAQALSQMAAIDYRRIDERMYVELVLCEDMGGTLENYVNLVRAADKTGRTLILHCRDVHRAEAGLAACGGRAILNGATPDNWAEMNRLAMQTNVPLGVWAETLEDRYDTVKKLEAAGNKNLVLDVTGKTVGETLKNAVLVRRTALKDGDRSFGYPSIVNLHRLAPGDDRLQTAYAALFTLKYGSVLVMEHMTYPQALPLYGLRQNIYTDPQKPMKVESKVYPINGADENSPCCLTVDFALTYFLVSGELERSNMPVNLLIMDASGMSVLTAWAAGKLSAAAIKKFFVEHDIENRIKSRILIIPGKVAVMKEEIRQVLPGWKVVAGTDEAAQIPQYMRSKAYELEEDLPETTVQAAEARELTFEELLLRVPPVEVVDTGVTYQRRNVESKRFVTIGERIHCISPTIRRAMDERDPMPILKRAAEQIAAGATYLDVNIGPAEKDGPERMMWAVKLLQQNFQNVPLALDTTNQKAIEAGIRVYDRTNGKPIINSADAGSRISLIDLAAANDAICIALCSADGIARDNEERMRHCHTMLERGLRLNMPAEDLWFDPLFLVVKGMQDKQMDVLNAIRLFSQEGLRSTGGVSNNSNGAPKAVRPIMDATLIAMAMMQGLTSAILNPCDKRMMETIKTCDIFKNHVLYADSYLEE